jgi:hypothetical protein
LILLQTPIATSEDPAAPDAPNFECDIFSDIFELSKIENSDSASQENVTTSSKANSTTRS